MLAAGRLEELVLTCLRNTELTVIRPSPAACFLALVVTMPRQ